MTTNNSQHGGLGLGPALSFMDGMSRQMLRAAQEVHTGIASLQAGGVSGDAITEMAQLGEQYTLAGEAFIAAHAHLTDHLAVTEAYNANPGAGTREFNTSN